MILIIGGYAQGKAEYVREKYGVSSEYIIYLNRWVKERMQMFEDAAKLFDETEEKEKNEHREYILIAEEIGNGIVPVDPYERELREKTGRVQIEAAKRAKEVIRIICGIGQKIK